VVERGGGEEGVELIALSRWKSRVVFMDFLESTPLFFSSSGSLSSYSTSQLLLSIDPFYIKLQE